MSKLKKVLVPTLVAAAAAVAVSFAVSHAQQAPSPGAGQRPGPRGAFQPPSPETLQRLQDGRIAGAKATLRLTDEQAKLWAPVESVIREGYAAREKRMREMRERFAQPGAQRPPLPDALDRMSQRMSERAQRMKQLADAVKPLYATLSDEQKAVLGPVMRHLAGFDRGMGGHRGHHGRRWAERGGQGGQPPQQ